jgi:hypothetical protein
LGIEWLNRLDLLGRIGPPQRPIGRLCTMGTTAHIVNVKEAVGERIWEEPQPSLGHELPGFEELDGRNEGPHRGLAQLHAEAFVGRRGSRDTKRDPRQIIHRARCRRRLAPVTVTFNYNRAARSRAKSTADRTRPGPCPPIQY